MPATCRSLNGAPTHRLIHCKAHGGWFERSGLHDLASERLFKNFERMIKFVFMLSTFGNTAHGM